MFKLGENYEMDRRILKSGYLGYSPGETSTLNIPDSQININILNIHREDSVNSLLKSYLDLHFEVIKKAENFIYAHDKDITLVNLGPIALFSIFKLTISSGKPLEDISHAHIVSLMYKLKSSAKDFDDLSIGFDSSRDRRKQELTNNKNIKGKDHVRIMPSVL